MRKQNSDFKTSFLSEVGTQLENRDYHGYVELDDFACWVVADGIDESETKKSAELVVKGVLEAFSGKPGSSRRHLREYLNTAHRILKRESTQVRLKASVMIVVSDYIILRYAHAGNVRLQTFFDSLIELESRDHSYYQDRVNDGTFHMDRSTGFEERNNLTNYAGIPKGFKAHVSKKYKLDEMETVLITTVGFWEHVTNIEVLDGLDNTSDPKEVTDNLEDQLLSKQADDLSNYTIAAIFVNKLFLKEKKIWSIILKIFLVLLPILIVLGIWLFFRHRSNQTQQELTERATQYKFNGGEYIAHGSFARALEQYSSAIALLSEIRSFDYEDVLRLKHRVNQLIVDGYAAVEREDFERAREYFIRARNYLIDEGHLIPLFESEHIIVQIDYIDVRIYIDELIALGDLQVELGQYGRALDTYRSARTVAIGLNNLPLMQRLNISVETAQALYDDENQSVARAEAEEAEQRASDGEGLKPEELAGLFEDVAGMYQDAGLYEDAARMRARADEIRNDAAASDILEQQQLAGELEANGDEALLEGDYENALAYYQAAERIYRSINSDFNITLIAQKILAANDLINAEEERERQAIEDEEERERQAIADEEDRERQAAEEAQRQILEEEERQALEEAQRQALEEAQRQAFEDEQRQAFEDAQRQAFEEAQRQAFEDAQRQAFEDAQRQAAEEQQFVEQPPFYLGDGNVYEVAP